MSPPTSAASEVERGGRGEARRDATEWPRVPLGELAHIIAGQSPPGSTYRRQPVGLPFFQGKADFGDRHPVARVWCTEPNKIALPGDVLMSIRAPVGPTNVADTECCIGRGLAALRCGPTLDRDYLLWFLRCIEADIAKQGSGSTFHAINRDQLEALEIPLPPLVEQERIAGLLTEQLGAVERARAAAAHRLAAAESLPAALLREIFEGPQASGWETRTIDEFAKTCSGATPSRGNAAYFGGGIPWVKTGELRDGFVGDDGSTEESVTEAALRDCSLPLLPPGTLLIAMYGQGKTRGRTGILTREATTNQACFAILPDPDVFDTGFLQLWFRANYLGLRALTENRGGNQPNLNGVLLRELEVPLPDPATQRRLAAELTQRLTAAEGVIARCREELAAIEALPAALLREAFGGAHGA
jgi:type I restriction enzyme S subunit